MYDVIIIGAGPGGIFSAYELMKQDENLKIAVFDAGRSLEQRHCLCSKERPASNTAIFKFSSCFMSS